MPPQPLASAENNHLPERQRSHPRNSSRVIRDPKPQIQYQNRGAQSDTDRPAILNYRVVVVTVLFIRHGLTQATGDMLSGHELDYGLNEQGQRQVATLAERLADVDLAAVVTSPLVRCMQTAQAIVENRPNAPLETDDRLIEVRYGDWAGRKLADLVRDPLWRQVQNHPSSVVFPGPNGEGLADTQARAVRAVRDWNRRLGSDAIYAVCSHGDVIKSVLADALGMHLDLFQRIVVDPSSLSVVHYTARRPFVSRLNDTGESISGWLAAQHSGRSRYQSDAVVGGDAGPTA